MRNIGGCICLSILAVIVSGVSLGATLLLKQVEAQAMKDFAAIQPAGFNILDPLASLRTGTEQFISFIRLQIISALIWTVAIGGTLISAYIIFRDYGPAGLQPGAIAIKTARKTPQATGARAARDVLKGVLKNG